MVSYTQLSIDLLSFSSFLLIASIFQFLTENERDPLVVVMVVLKRYLVQKLDNQLPPLVEAPPLVVVEQQQPKHSSNGRSIETLVVVLAVITIVAVIAGIIARLCGGRHMGGGGEHDIEGWVERKCRSCIDSGIPPPPPQEPPKPAAAAETEEAKK